MARIDPELIERIKAKKSIGRTAAYNLIQKVQHETLLEPDLAALLLATRLNINIGRHSTPEQRLRLQGYGRGHALPPPAPAAQAAAPQTRIRRGNTSKPQRPNDNSVFVIGGRDKALNDSMFAFLRALGCKPVAFHQAVANVKGTGTPFIGQVLDDAFAKGQALIVLFSPDEEAILKEQFMKKEAECRSRDQARPNVIFEAGMAMARHPEKTIMVQVGEMADFSDIAGRHMVHLDDTIESRNAFAVRLGKICKVDTTAHDWMTAGRFVPTMPSSKRSSR